MTGEDKNLLLRDLCSRLPYDIVVKDEYGDYIEVNIYTANLEHLIDRVSAGIVKMVLRPMSSMTEEEKKEFKEIFKGSFQYFNSSIISDSRIYDRNEAVFVGEEKCGELIDWLNKNMFDYRGLIPKDIVLSTEEFNPYKK